MISSSPPSSPVNQRPPQPNAPARPEPVTHVNSPPNTQSSSNASPLPPRNTDPSAVNGSDFAQARQNVANALQDIQQIQDALTSVANLSGRRSGAVSSWVRHIGHVVKTGHQPPDLSALERLDDVKKRKSGDIKGELELLDYLNQGPLPTEKGCKDVATDLSKDQKRFSLTQEGKTTFHNAAKLALLQRIGLWAPEFVQKYFETLRDNKHLPYPELQVRLREVVQAQLSSSQATTSAADAQTPRQQPVLAPMFSLAPTIRSEDLGFLKELGTLPRGDLLNFFSYLLGGRMSASIQPLCEAMNASKQQQCGDSGDTAKAKEFNELVMAEILRQYAVADFTADIQAIINDAKPKGIYPRQELLTAVARQRGNLAESL